MLADNVNRTWMVFLQNVEEGNVPSSTASRTSTYESSSFLVKCVLFVVDLTKLVILFDNDNLLILPSCFFKFPNSRRVSLSQQANKKIFIRDQPIKMQDLNFHTIIALPIPLVDFRWKHNHLYLHLD